jgi:hypothetical protein
MLGSDNINDRPKSPAIVCLLLRHTSILKQICVAGAIALIRVAVLKDAPEGVVLRATDAEPGYMSYGRAWQLSASRVSSIVVDGHVGITGGPSRAGARDSPTSQNPSDSYFGDAVRLC